MWSNRAKTLVIINTHIIIKHHICIYICNALFTGINIKVCMCLYLILYKMFLKSLQDVSKINS